MDRKSVINLFRFIKRLEKYPSDELITQFEKDLFNAWDSLNQEHPFRSQKDLIDKKLIKIKSNHEKKKELVDDRQELLGKRLTIDKTVDDIERAQLEKEILRMAREMKTAAVSFKDTLKMDNRLLEKISTSQTQQLMLVKQENKHLTALNVKTGFFSTLRSFLAVICSGCVFIFMIVFIWMFPNKEYVYITRDA